MRAESFQWAVRGAGFALGAAAILAVLQVGLLARDVLVLVFVAVLLASALEPAVDVVRERINVPRGVVILAVYAVFFTAVAILGLVILPTAVTQLAALANQAPGYFDRATSWAASLRPALLGSAVTALLEGAQKTLVAAPPKPGQVVEAGLTVAQVVASLATMLAVVFFWLVEHAQLQRYALSFLPAQRRAGAREAWDDVERRLGQWVRGQLTLMGVMGVATGILYTALGLPSPLLLGLIAALAEGIPIVGPLLGAIPALVLAATISPQLVLVVAVAYVVIQLVESNVLVPIVMRHTVGLSAFLVIVSILVGAAIAGIPGAFLAVPLLAAVEVILERLEARDVPVTQAAVEPEIVDEPPRGTRRDAGARPDRPRRSAPASGRQSATS